MTRRKVGGKDKAVALVVVCVEAVCNIGHTLAIYGSEGKYMVFLYKLYNTLIHIKLAMRN